MNHSAPPPSSHHDAETLRAFSIYNASPDSILITNPEGFIEYTNPAWETSMGLSLIDVLGKPWLSLPATQAVKRICTRAYAQLSQGENYTTTEVAHTRDDGAGQFTSMTLYPMLLDHGLTFFVRSERNVTVPTSKTSAESVSARRCKDLMELASDGILILDRQRQIIDANKQVCELLGYTKRELTGKHAAELVVAEDLGVTQSAISRLIAGEHVETERIVRRKDGALLNLESHTAAIDADTFQAIIRDVTQRRQLQHQLQESVSRYQNMFEHASDGIIVFTPQLQITDANERFCDISGYTKDELLIMPVTHLLLPEEAVEVDSAIGQLQHGESLFSDRTLKKKDGGLLIVEASSRLVQENLFKAIVRDVTVHRRDQMRIKALHQRVISILNSISDSFFSLDTDWCFTFVNKNAKRMFPTKSTNFIGKSIWSIYPALVGTELEQTYRQAMIQQRNYTTTQTSPSGRSYRIHCYPSPVGLSVYFTDVTLEENVAKRQKAFMGVASHELKSPLTSIVLTMQLLTASLAKSTDDKSQSYAKSLATQVQRLKKLTESLLDTSLIETGNMALNMQPFLLDQLVEEVVTQNQPLSAQHRLQIEALVRQEVVADRTRISQVLNNFVNNAIKYSPQADRILIRMSKQPDAIIVSVQDFGIGMTPDQQQNIFTDYYRTSMGKETATGLGLGLYIAYNIAKAHGGTIWVSSELGQGSTFSLSLPLPENSTADPAP